MARVTRSTKQEPRDQDLVEPNEKNRRKATPKPLQRKSVPMKTIQNLPDVQLQYFSPIKQQKIDSNQGRTPLSRPSFHQINPAVRSSRQYAESSENTYKRRYDEGTSSQFETENLGRNYYDESSDSDSGTSNRYEKTGNEHPPRHIKTENFSISKEFHDEDSVFTSTHIDKIRTALSEGNVMELGKSIRNGIRSGELGEVQLEEIAAVSQRPKIPLYSALIANENADFEGIKSLNAGLLFLESLPPAYEKEFNQLQCNINSLSHTVKAGSGMKTLEHRPLDSIHRIQAQGDFNEFDLNRFYMNHHLLGDTPSVQITHLLVQVLRNATKPVLSIWKYAFYPKSGKTVDINFKKLPPFFLQKLQDFCLDVTSSYLPDEILVGPVPFDHEFLERFGSGAMTEIDKRRLRRQSVLRVIGLSLWQALRTLRNYHFDVSSGELMNCTSRGNCSTHIKWEHLKSLRESLRHYKVDPDVYDVSEIVEHIKQSAAKSSEQPPPMQSSSSQTSQPKHNKPKK